MKVQSFSEDSAFNDQKIVTKVVLETSFSKEIRILMKKGQLMKEHRAPFPIVVHLLSGEVDFGVEGETHTMIAGTILTLTANVPHDLKAAQDSVVRLTLSKHDTAERLEEVIQ